MQVAKAQVESLEKALDLYRLDIRRYPSTEQGLKALIEKPASEANWKGPYLRKAIPADPWGNAYLYRQPGAKHDFDLVSYGRDGKPGGSGDETDITN